MSNALEPLAHRIDGTGAPLLLVHGLTFSGSSWDPIVDRLRDRFTCITVDLPGHAGSARSAIDPRQLAERIDATIAGRCDQPVVVVGHSAGAVYASAYAALTSVRGVVNVDQTMAIGGFSAILAQFAPALRGPDWAATFAPFEASIGVDSLPEPERSRVQADRTVTQDVILDHWHLPMTSEPAAAQQDIDGLLDRIRAPYLWIASKASEADREHLLAHVPQAEIELCRTAVTSCTSPRPTGSPSGLRSSRPPRCTSIYTILPMRGPRADS